MRWYCFVSLLFFLAGISGSKASSFETSASWCQTYSKNPIAALSNPPEARIFNRPQNFRDSWFAPDKFDHLLGSAMLSGSSYLALKVTGNPKDEILVSTVGTVIGIGILKEVYDLYHPGHQASWKDLTVDLLGAFAGAIIARAL